MNSRIIRQPERTRGSALLTVIFLVLILGVVAGSILKVSVTELKLAENTYLSNLLLNLAESGAEEAAWSLNNDDWSDWVETDDGDFVRHITDIDSGNGILAEIYVIVVKDESVFPPVVLYSEGRTTTRNGQLLRKQIRMELTYRSLFANGLTAKDQLTLNGGTAKFDSYDSNFGGPGLGNRNAEATVATLSILFGDLSAGNSEVYGWIATGGGTPSFGPNAKVYGEDWATGDDNIDLDRVSLDFYAEFPNAVAPTLGSSKKTSISGIDTGSSGGSGVIGARGRAAPPGGSPPGKPPKDDPPVVDIDLDIDLGSGVVIGTSGTEANPEEYELDSLNMKSKDTLIIDGHVLMVISGDVDVKGEIQVTDGSTLRMYIDGDMDVGGHGIFNGNTVASSMLVYGTATSEGAQEFKYHGSASFIGAFYAPNATFTLSGGGSGPTGTGGQFNGAAVAYQITVNGGFEFHYDEQLGNFYSGDPTFQLSGWWEMQIVDEMFDIAAAYAAGS